jgi:hypothetical protein
MLDSRYFHNVFGKIGYRNSWGRKINGASRTWKRPQPSITLESFSERTMIRLSTEQPAGKTNFAIAFGLVFLILFFQSTCSDGVPAFGEDPVLKPDIPKLDLTVPKSKTLRGGVQHQESAATVDTQNSQKKLSTGVFDSIKRKKKEKLNGQAAKLAPNSTLKSGASNDLLNAQVPNGIGIIGVKFLLPIGHMPIINRVFPGTPAWTVGLHAHDVIVAVDGVPTLGLSKQDVYNMIVGKPDTEVTISIRRGADFLAKTMKRMDFNDIPDPLVRQDYLMSI